MTEAERNARLEAERIARLEGRLDRIEVDITEIKREQAAAMGKQQDYALDARDLRGELSRAIDLLETHQTWHSKHEEKKYKLTDIVMAVGMLLLGIFTAVKG